MTIKNKSQKIIGFGEDALLPGGTLDVSDNYKNNPVFKSYLKKGEVEVVKKKTTNTSDNKKPSKSAIEKAKTREDLIALAEKHNIEINDSMTDEEIKAALEA